MDMSCKKIDFNSGSIDKMKLNFGIPLTSPNNNNYIKQINSGIDNNLFIQNNINNNIDYSMDKNKNKLKNFNNNLNVIDNMDQINNSYNKCNCSKIGCIKKYCSCFSSGKFCNACECINCQNFPGNIKKSLI